MSRRFSHSDYFTDRRSEYELCRDFPADEIFIDGLHAMQTHFTKRGMYIDIPVVRVMNTAHWLACYMFTTTCSGDQSEYDVLTYNSLGQDKQLTIISLIVLAAMLKRTDGMRARTCRSVLLEERSEDFYEGVSLYEQFLVNGEAHFTQEDFETDVLEEVTTLREQNEQLVRQVITLQTTIDTMKTEQLHTAKDMNQQNNNSTVYNGSVYNGPVYQGCTITMVTPGASSRQTGGVASDEKGNDVSSDSSSSKKQGRRERSLFLQPDIAEQEKQRLLSFLHLHKLGSNDFDASEENSCNQIAICFFRLWAKRNLLNANVGGTALVRFLKNDCELSITVEEKTLGNAFSRMINGGLSYPDWFGSVSEFFQN